MTRTHPFIKLLLVDDSAEFRKLIMAYLKVYAFDIQEAEDGLEALELMKGQEFDVVLMDIRMPLMDGLTSTRLFRDWESQMERKHMIIIALSAFSLPHERLDTSEAGCDQFLSKPINRRDLVQTLNAVISRTKESGLW